MPRRNRLLPPDGADTRPEVRVTSWLTPVTLNALSVPALTASIVAGTLCRSTERRVAVTIISSTPARAASVAVSAGAVVVAAGVDGATGSGSLGDRRLCAANQSDGCRRTKPNSHRRLP